MLRGIEEKDVSIDSGTVKWGHEVSIGYFAQDHKGSIELGMTAQDWLHQYDPKAVKEDIRGILGQMLFKGEEGLKMTNALSGGEAARLLFCKIMLLKPNVLVLDEPTNHLDLESINALNQAIQKYEGTVFLVTHDQDLIEEAGTRIWPLRGWTERLPHHGPQGAVRGVSAAAGDGGEVAAECVKEYNRAMDSGAEDLNPEECAWPAAGDMRQRAADRFFPRWLLQYRSRRPGHAHGLLSADGGIFGDFRGDGQ